MRLALGFDVGCGTTPSGCARNRQQHRRLVARHQTLVGVGGRVGEGVDRLGVLDDAADVVEAGFREVGIVVAGEHRLAALPDRLVHVHARAVVAEHRLRHEGRRLAVGLRDVVDDVLVDLHVVGHADHRAELDAELVLRGGDFVVMLFDGDAHVGHHREHLASGCPGAVDRGNREVAALDARTMAEVAHLVVGAGVRGQLGAVEAVDVVGIGRELTSSKMKNSASGPK